MANQILEWALDVVGDDDDDDGTTISALFDTFTSSFANGDSEQLWQSILACEELLLDTDQKTNRALRRLTLEDVICLGFEEITIKKKKRTENGNSRDALGITARNREVAESTEQAQALPRVRTPPPRRSGRLPRGGKPVESVKDAETSQRADALKEAQNARTSNDSRESVDVSAPTDTTNDSQPTAVVQPPRKRRGRPPKVAKAAALKTTKVDADQSIDESINVAQVANGDTLEPRSQSGKLDYAMPLFAAVDTLPKVPKAVEKISTRNFDENDTMTNVPASASNLPTTIPLMMVPASREGTPQPSSVSQGPPQPRRSGRPSKKPKTNSLSTTTMVDTSTVPKKVNNEAVKPVEGQQASHRSLTQLRHMDTDCAPPLITSEPEASHSVIMTSISKSSSGTDMEPLTQDDAQQKSANNNIATPIQTISEPSPIPKRRGRPPGIKNSVRRAVSSVWNAMRRSASRSSPRDDLAPQPTKASMDSIAPPTQASSGNGLQVVDPPQQGIITNDNRGLNPSAVDSMVVSDYATSANNATTNTTVASVRQSLPPPNVVATTQKIQFDNAAPSIRRNSIPRPGSRIRACTPPPLSPSPSTYSSPYAQRSVTAISQPPISSLSFTSQESTPRSRAIRPGDTVQTHASRLKSAILPPRNVPSSMSQLTAQNTRVPHTQSIPSSAQTDSQQHLHHPDRDISSQSDGLLVHVSLVARAPVAASQMARKKQLPEKLVTKKAQYDILPSTVSDSSYGTNSRATSLSSDPKSAPKGGVKKPSSEPITNSIKFMPFETGQVPTEQEKENALPSLIASASQSQAWVTRPEDMEHAIFIPENPSLDVSHTMQTPKTGTRKRGASTSEHDEESVNEPNPKRQKSKTANLKVSNDAGATRLSKTPKKSKVKEMEAGLPSALAIPIPMGAFRLACTYDNHIGNLILSVDKAVLDFFGVDQHPPENPIYTLPVSDIPLDPTTSVKGSKILAMRIRQLLNNGRDDTATRVFKIPTTDEAFDTMVEMRARIVAARIHVKFQENDDFEEAEREILKPYACNTCDKRFKNQLGLDYHVSKSNTLCNPNRDPSKPLGGAGRKKKDPVESAVPSTPKSLRKGKSKYTEDDDGGVDRGARGNLSDSSEDSVIAWALQNATNGIEKVTPSKHKGPKPYRSIAGERALLEGIARGEFENPPEDAEGDVDMINVGNESSPPLIADAVDFTDQAAEEMLMSLIVDNYGIFPGDRAIWYAFVGSWMKKYPSSPVLPESKLCAKLLDGLCSSQRLIKIDFTFHDTRSRDATRSMFVTPSHDIESPVFAMMKDLIMAAYPGHYVPSLSAPPAKILQGLEALERPRSGQKRQQDMDASVDTDDDEQQDNQLEYTSFDEVVMAQEESAIGDSDAMLNDHTDSDEENSAEGKPKRKPRRRRDPLVGRLKDDQWKAEHSRRMKEWHIQRREQGLTMKRRTQTAYTPSAQRPYPGQRRKMALALAESRDDTWALAQSFIPNSTTGAWDSHPILVKPVRPIHRRPGFPEPITFMQAMDGMWSQRPFGHGVKPIFSRPTRAADGNPHRALYEKTIQEGHRPIVYPSKQLYFPSQPSKQLLRSQGLAEPRRKRVRLSTEGVESPEKDAVLPLISRTDEIDGMQVLERASSRVVDLDFTPEGIVEEDEEFNPDVDFDSEPKQRRARRSKKTAMEEEIQLLNFYEPRKLTHSALRNPGLDTMPRYFGLVEMVTNKAESLSAEDLAYTNVNFVQAQHVTGNSEFTNGSWTMPRSFLHKRRRSSVRFDEETAFSVENLPYHDLHDEEDLDGPEERPRKRAKFDKVGDPGVVYPSVRPGRRVFKTRYMTAMPVDFDGIVDNSKVAEKLFGVQLLETTKPIDLSRKRFHANDRMSTEDEARFLLTVTIISTVTGGIEQLVDWVLVSLFFPVYSTNYLKKLWGELCTKKKNLLDQLKADFQDAFLLAYQNGQIPPIDFDNLVGYDWGNLIRWAKDNIDTSLVSKHINLPATRAGLKKEFVMAEPSRTGTQSQDSFFSITAPVYRRLQEVSSQQNTLPIHRSPLNPIPQKINQLTVARSLARATALTPTKHWDADAARAKLSKLGLSNIERALIDLKAEGIITKRKKEPESAGRPYEGSDSFAFALRKQVRPKILAEAYTFKTNLDTEFRSGKPCVRVDYLGNEGSYMVTTSLLASGRVRTQGVDIPMNRWGLGDEETGYETRRINRAKLRWEIDMYPTETYLYNEDITQLQTFQGVEPPRGSASGELPIWYGITDMVNQDLWKKSLAAVAGVVALRSGVVKKELTRVFKPALEGWEIDLLVGWGEMLGIFETVDNTGKGFEGLAVGEWWWLMAGSACVDREKGKGKERVDTAMDVDLYD